MRLYLDVSVKSDGKKFHFFNVEIYKFLLSLDHDFLDLNFLDNILPEKRWNRGPKSLRQ